MALFYVYFKLCVKTKCTLWYTSLNPAFDTVRALNASSRCRTKHFRIPVVFSTCFQVGGDLFVLWWLFKEFHISYHVFTRLCGVYFYSWQVFFEIVFFLMFDFFGCWFLNKYYLCIVVGVRPCIACQTIHDFKKRLLSRCLLSFSFFLSVVFWFFTS